MAERFEHSHTGDYTKPNLLYTLTVFRPTKLNDNDKTPMNTFIVIETPKQD